MRRVAGAFVVHGRVTGHDGRGIEGAQVVVWRQHIREQVRLAGCRSGEEGRYRANYKVPEHSPAKPLILVRATSKHLAPPVKSAIVEAQPDLELNLAPEAPDKSEFATLAVAVQPLLDGLHLTDLVENDEHRDLSFLARETGRPAEDIMRVAVAARLAASFPPVPAAAFWAFLRERVPSSLPNSLLDASKGFKLISSFVEQVATPDSWGSRPNDNPAL